VSLVLDTGVVYAAVDRGDRHHEECRGLLERTTEPLVLPAPTLPELDYWLTRYLGPMSIVSLLRDIEAGLFHIEELRRNDYVRAAAVMEANADLEIGFVDSAVLAIIERLGERKLATLDHRHFSVVRPRHVPALELLP
jgi:predicted nucleic acid-binding protein